MTGAPTIRGTRITVSAVLGQLAAGSTVEELAAGSTVEELAAGSTVEDLLADYPSLTREDVPASLAFAAESMPQERG